MKPRATAMLIAIRRTLRRWALSSSIDLVTLAIVVLA